MEVIKSLVPRTLLSRRKAVLIIQCTCVYVYMYVCVWGDEG